MNDRLAKRNEIKIDGQTSHLLASDILSLHTLHGFPIVDAPTGFAASVITVELISHAGVGYDMSGTGGLFVGYKYPGGGVGAQFFPINANDVLTAPPAAFFGLNPFLFFENSASFDLALVDGTSFWLLAAAADPIGGDASMTVNVAYHLVDLNA